MKVVGVSLAVVLRVLEKANYRSAIIKNAVVEVAGHELIDLGIIVTR